MKATKTELAPRLLPLSMIQIQKKLMDQSKGDRKVR
jgi:hypothetical protein